MNIYSSHIQRVTALNPGNISKGQFKREMDGEEFSVAGEMKKIYMKLKGDPQADMERFEILKVMASYLYPKPTLNIQVTPGEMATIPTELENKSSAELQALLPQTVNE